MADKKLRRCSGSSLNLRAQMDQNYVIVHDVSSNVSFEMYIQFARGCFDQAVKLYNKKDYQRAYVDFTKFHQFVKDKLPSHQNYDKGRTEVAKIWLQQADEACLEFLEEISFQLDALEDEKNNPNSRSPLLVDMQNHNVDIFIPEWIDLDSDDEETSATKKDVSTSNTTSHGSHRIHGELPLHNHSVQHPTSVPHQQYPAPPQHIAHSHSASELPLHAPLHRAERRQQSEPRGYAAHSESQDLAQAIQESLISAQSPHVDAYTQAHQEQHAHRTLERESYEQRTYSSDPRDQRDPRAALHYVQTPSTDMHHYRQSSVPHHHFIAERYTDSTGAVHQHRAHSVSSSSHHTTSSHCEGTSMAQQSPVLHHHQSTEHFYSTTRSSSAGHALTWPSLGLPHFVMPGLTQNDAAILKYCRGYTTFDIPPPTVARHSIYIKDHAHHFEQHDFHLSFAPFLRALPPELHMSRAAVEVNRCFFIHLGVATQLHPFALQSYFRHTAAAERAIEADWEVELARSISDYASCVDANVLQYTWPENFDKYRILLISGPANDPLLTCFVPKNRNRAVEDLYEIVIRNDRSHFTLLRPLANLTSKIKIIDAMLRDAEQAHSMYQVCDVASKPNRSVGAIFEKI